jgi:hypothetical protein
LQHTPSANNGEQHKDNKHNNNNIANYFKPNKHTQLDLAKKNNENLVEVLICNAIDKAADYSHPKLSMPSSSRFNSDPFNQNGTYKIEKSESHHHDS